MRATLVLLLLFVAAPVQAESAGYDASVPALDADLDAAPFDAAPPDAPAGEDAGVVGMDAPAEVDASGEPATPPRASGCSARPGTSAGPIALVGLLALLLRRR